MEATLTEIDRLYFPHQWQKRFGFDEVLEKHIRFFNEKSEEVKKKIRSEFNVPYGFLPRERYDIFGIDLPEDSPIFIHIHGGYWQVKEISHNNQAFIAKVLHKHKIKVIAIGYEMCPAVTVSSIIIEIEVAIKRCLDYAKKCKSRGVYLSGHSVGAHLVASLFSNCIPLLPYEDQYLIKAVFLSCGLYDITPISQTIINEGLKLTIDTAKEISPQYMNLTCPANVKIHVIAAEHDSPAYIEQGKDFYEKLIESGIKANYLLLKDVDHFNAIEKMVEDNFEVVKLILDNVR